ncbi:3-oxoacyl-[acyl-carrier-protein] synthase, mitochondrial [Condylostylus longicornis]|uniref:3-oxoacyl-[acyl-carrier-protein] synthase, mitochondrial n=1 Tax=Condylostylus longicornis TaxID=2530218 RepID=UPI00244DB241|nr:3-oxoacyl-[acyl-carrier-protein] synthase, mitochondrial [Condylostylus longicornis]
MKFKPSKNVISLFLNKNFSTHSNHNGRRVVVTGLGAVTPLGNNVQTSWTKILAGESSITNLSGEEYNKLPCKVAAQIDKNALNLENYFKKSDIKSMSPATLLALLASEEALTSANLKDIPDKNKDRIGVCVGMGMFDLSDVYLSYQNLVKGYNRVSPFFIPRILPNMACGHISMRYNFRGPNHSVSTACATGAHAIGDAFRFIKYGDADIMLAGSGESCIDALSIAGFCRLRALSTTFNDEPSKASRPFDKKRDGFVMGEGSAILILESLENAKMRNAPILAEILGYGLSGDAYHLTSPSEDGFGAQLAMKRAIEEAKLDSSQIGYVNAHATSTPTGDKIEAKAISLVLGRNDVEVSSTKGAHGHLLGSSGNLEALFVVKACHENILPPSINIDQLDDDININIVRKSKKWNTDTRRIALKNSFGFGGTNCCLCISSFTN